MNKTLWAKTRDDAETVARNNTPDPSGIQENEIIKIEVRKGSEVLINHSGEVPIQTGGWIFTFDFKSVSGWILVNTENTM